VKRPFWGAAGLFVLGAGLVALIRDVPVWNVAWYVPAWYGYLLIVDAALFIRRGESFVSGRHRELLEMLFWSLPFWFFFEAVNLVLRNWYYVFGFRSEWAGAAMAIFAYATVLPACLLHGELLEAWGVFREKRCRPLPARPSWPSLAVAGGIACVALPLLLPQFGFPLIWFAPIGLDGLNFRRRAPSLLRDLEEGNCGRLLRLLVGGLWAGVVWESVNSVARCKWIYTVPGFEELKIFEMPIAGFLGFPILAVGAYCFFSFVRGLPAKSWWVAAVLLAAASAAVEPLVVRETVRSQRPILTELEGLDAAAARRLRSAGIPTPERLSRAAAKEGIGSLSARTSLPSRLLARAVGHADLSLHKGMGAARAALLRACGVERVADLSRYQPDALWTRLTVCAATLGQDPPRLAEVRVWVRAAQASGGRPAR
jgi:Domain of unknown function (DUF4332)